MAGWTTLEMLLKEEIIQRCEEGCIVDGFAERLEALGKDKQSLDKLYDELMALKIEADFPYNEPSGLEGIKALNVRKILPCYRRLMRLTKTVFTPHGLWSLLRLCLG